MVYFFPPNQINGMAILQWLLAAASLKKTAESTSQQRTSMRFSLCAKEVDAATAC